MRTESSDHNQDGKNWIDLEVQQMFQNVAGEKEIKTARENVRDTMSATLMETPCCSFVIVYSGRV
jgi:hypothetical protein